MIQIDRVNADVEVQRSAAPGAAADGNPLDLLEGAPLDRLRLIVMEVLREHLRDLERQGRL